MAELIFLKTEEIQKIQNYLQIPDLDIHVREDWGSDHPPHREQIHQALQQRKSKEADGAVATSISHCQGLGGFIFKSSAEDLHLGFDIEVDSRVKPAIARRVCQSDEEFAQAPSPASLWTAKEAAFKSLKGPQQPLVVTSLVICDWQQIDSQFETASLANPQIYGSSRIYGVLFKKFPFTLAFFVRRT